MLAKSLEILLELGLEISKENKNALRIRRNSSLHVSRFSYIKSDPLEEGG